MNTITIPGRLAKKGDLVVIPRKEYEEFLELKKIIPLVRPTKAEVAALERGRRQVRQGHYVTWRDFKNELAALRRRSGKRAASTMFCLR